MKINLSVLRFVALVTLVACQREKVADNPTYDPEANTVVAKLVLNVSPGSASPQTKQTGVAVQAGGGNFRGMQDVHLLTYSVGKAGPKGDAFLFNVSEDLATKDFDLGAMLQEGDVNEENGVRVLELALPLETNTILVYGRATHSGEDEVLGHVDSEGSALNVSLENVTFSLKNRMNGRDAEFKLFGDMMGRILTVIMNSGLEEQTAERGYKVLGGTPKDGRFSFWWPDDDTGKSLPQVDENGEHYPNLTEKVVNGETYTLHYGHITWRDMGEKYANGESQTAPEEILAEAYHNIMTIQSKEEQDAQTGNVNTLKELRAASSAAVLRLTEDLYSIMSRVITITPLTPEEKIAQLMATEIISKARYFFTLDAAGNLVYQPLGTILSGIDALVPERDRQYYAAITDDFFYREEQGQLGFPVNLGMPMGSAIMTFTNPYIESGGASGTPDYYVVTYLEEIPAYGVGGGTFPVTNYRYPAELLYYTNSHLRTSDAAMQNIDFPAYTQSWWNDSYWTGWTGGSSIQSSTRSVAVAKTINYGTALMATRVGYSSATVNDNNKGLHPSETANTIDVSRIGNAFEVTGIMIGGVADEVGWDFLPKSALFNKIIYDNIILSMGENGKGLYIPRYSASEADRLSQEMYTLTFDNYNKTLGPDEQSVVYIALELRNNTGQDLWGELNMIRKDGIFYLVGELDPGTLPDSFYKGTGENRKVDLSRDDFNYPPFDENGNTIHAPRVFMQDYVTSVKLNFTPSSLSHAYVTMPDLRSGQISLGLSVDVSWEKGYDFDVDLGVSHSSF